MDYTFLLHYFLKKWTICFTLLTSFGVPLRDVRGPRLYETRRSDTRVLLRPFTPTDTDLTNHTPFPSNQTRPQSLSSSPSVTKGLLGKTSHVATV